MKKAMDMIKEKTPRKMNAKERITIQENLKKIEKNIFCQNDIYMIYTGLRQYVKNGCSPHENIVYELSNFVCHNDVRNRGATLETFNDFYNVSLYLASVMTGVKVDFNTNFPSNIKSICLNKLKRMEEEKVKELFGESKDIILKIIEKAIICNKDNSAFIDKSVSKIVYDIILDLLNRVPVEPLFSDEDIINSLINVLDMNEIKYNKELLLKQKEKIILSLLVLMHHTEFKSELNCKIYCHIYYYIGKNNLSLNLGYLVPNNERIGFMYEAITTNLSIYDHCSKKLLERHNQDMIEKNGSVFNSELGLNSEFKLVEMKLDE